jgi:COMPASS component SWD3
LCYLLTCKSVQDASSFKNWEGGKEGRSREKLVEQFESLLNVDHTTGVSGVHNGVNTHRLTDLLSQAVAFQVETTTNHTPKVTPKINT